MFDAFEMNHNFEKFKKEEKNRVWLCLMKFDLEQTFHQTSPPLSNRICMFDAFESNFIEQFVFYHYIECKIWKMECLSNVFDIRMFKKAQKTKQKKIGHFSKWKTNHQVMSSDTDSEFEADPIKNGDLFQKNLVTKKKVEEGKKDSKATKPTDSKQSLRKIGWMVRFHY